MITAAFFFASACFGLALLCNLWQLTQSDRVGDRVLALDTMVINCIALLVLFGQYNKSVVYFEASMVFAMLGFISTVAYTRFVLRGNIIE